MKKKKKKKIYAWERVYNVSYIFWVSLLMLLLLSCSFGFSQGSFFTFLFLLIAGALPAGFLLFHFDLSKIKNYSAFEYFYSLLIYGFFVFNHSFFRFLSFLGQHYYCFALYYIKNWKTFLGE